MQRPPPRWTASRACCARSWTGWCPRRCCGCRPTSNQNTPSRRSPVRATTRGPAQRWSARAGQEVPCELCDLPVWFPGRHGGRRIRRHRRLHARVPGTRRRASRARDRAQESQLGRHARVHRDSARRRRYLRDREVDAMTKTVVPLSTGDARKAVQRFGKSPRTPAVPLLPAGVDEAVWLEARRRDGETWRIGASELAAVLGASPYASPFSLWWAKQGGAWSEQTREQRRGHAYEPAIGGMFAEDHPDLFVCRPGAGLWGHPVHRWLVCTPDFLAVARDIAACTGPPECEHGHGLRC